MKKILARCALLAFFAGAIATQPVRAVSPKKALVVSFAYNENIGDVSSWDVDALASASLGRPSRNVQDNIRTIVEEVRRKTGADAFAIHTAEPYDSDYNVMRVRTRREHADDARPALRESRVENLAAYDVVYLATPIWHGGLPQAIFTFLDANDLSGKELVLTTIHLGSRFGSIPQQIRERYPGIRLADGYTVSASARNDEVRRTLGAFLDGRNR
ncbi:MAG: hypothetical protein IJU32_01800 [Pyramidobacter sp.]|nr:hypothetical protein [Pyramidobacter sp.]